MTRTILIIALLLLSGYQHLELRRLMAVEKECGEMVVGFVNKDILEK